MHRRIIGLIVTLGLGILTAPLASDAQAPTKVPRIGVLSQFSPPSEPSAPFEGFGAGLRQLGYLEGQNVALEYRYAEGRYERLSQLAAELVRLPVDVMVAMSPPQSKRPSRRPRPSPSSGSGCPRGPPRT